MLHIFLNKNYMRLTVIIKKEFIDYVLPNTIFYRTLNNNWSVECGPLNKFVIYWTRTWIDLTSDDTTIKIIFVSPSLIQFWTHVKLQYRELANEAFKNWILFTTPYLCGTRFSTLAVIKTKYWSKVYVEKKMKMTISYYSHNLNIILWNINKLTDLTKISNINVYLLSIKYLITIFSTLLIYLWTVLHTSYDK